MSTEATISPVRRRDEPIQVVYDNRLPYPEEILAYGGQVGVQYAIVSSTNLGDFQKEGWSMTREVGGLQVSGPSGDVAVLVLSKGRPVSGADPLNGSRLWFYDPDIYSLSGLEEPPPDSEPTHTQE